MAEEHRLTGAELLQHFLSRYRVDEVAAENGLDLSDAHAIADPVAATNPEDEPEATGG